MSVIQKIRDKGALISAILIGLALLGFILMDAFAGRGSIFGGNTTTVGKINGKKVEFTEFEAKIKAQEEMARQQGQSREDLVQSVWNQQIGITLLEEQYEELGITTTDKEINHMLYVNPAEDLKQQFSDPATGQYNAQALQQYIQSIRQSNTEEGRQAYAQMNQYIEGMEFNRKMEKYNSLLSNGTYYAKWYLEKQNAANGLVANISYVAIPYASIPDSAAKVSDEEIKEYIEDHKKQFEQKVETRAISYVTFSAAPSAADSAATLQQVEQLKPGFETTGDVQSFLTQNGSALEFFDGYLSGEKIQIAVKDSIFALPNGGVYGPYLDGGHYVLAKKIDQKVLPDSATVRHILVQTYNPQTQQVLRDDNSAKQRIDSIYNAVKAGANFEMLAQQLSDDGGSKDKGGVYEYFPQGQMVKAFNDFVFEKPVGTMDVVKTEFGYHLIEILGQKGSSMSYKIAYMAKDILPSTETDNQANNAANMFAGDSRNLKQFNENFDKNLKGKGQNKLVAENIAEMDFNVSGIGASRELVRAIYEADEGDVLKPVKVGDNYVVAAVTLVNEAGLMSVAQARTQVEAAIRNKKKAEQIKKKLGKITSLEAAASAFNQQVQVADSLRFLGSNPALGFEQKVLGAAFNPANKGKVVQEAIEGQSGVYVIRVNSIGTTPVQVAGIEEQRKQMIAQVKGMMQYRAQMGQGPIDALRNAADIEDFRAKFY